MFILDDILLFPLTGFKFILRTLEKTAEEQYTDDAPLKEALLELQMKLETGDITEDEYIQQEGQILRDLREIQNRKREMAGVAREEAPPQGARYSGEATAYTGYGPSGGEGGAKVR